MKRTIISMLFVALILTVFVACSSSPKEEEDFPYIAVVTTTNTNPSYAGTFYVKNADDYLDIEGNKAPLYKLYTDKECTELLDVGYTGEGGDGYYFQLTIEELIDGPIDDIYFSTVVAIITTENNGSNISDIPNGWVPSEEPVANTGTIMTTVNAKKGDVITVTHQDGSAKVEFVKDTIFYIDYFIETED